MGFLRLCKCIFNCIAILTIIAAILLFTPGLPPHNMQFTAYDLPPLKKLEGTLKINGKLDNAERLFENLIKGPESLVYRDGVLYTGVHGGLVVKIIDNKLIPFVKFGKSCDGIHEEHICGRPLGLFIDSAKMLYVADAYYGLFKVNTTTGEVVQLVHPDTVIEGRKPKLFNSVVVAADGKIYWTDSDSNVDLKNLGLSMFGDGTGRLIRYDPGTKSNVVLIDRLSFGNGVALALDESFILVTETFKSRVMKYHLKGLKKGSSEVFVDGLPGWPDNLKRDEKGNFYISLVVARDEDTTPSIILNIGKYPLLRKLIARSLAVLQSGFSVVDSVFPHTFLKKITHSICHCETFLNFMPKNPRVTIIKVNKDGTIIDSLHSLDERISGISEIEFADGYAYLASPFNHYLARVDLKNIS